MQQYQFLDGPYGICRLALHKLDDGYTELALEAVNTSNLIDILLPDHDGVVIPVHLVKQHAHIVHYLWVLVVKLLKVVEALQRLVEFAKFCQHCGQNHKGKHIVLLGLADSNDGCCLGF